MRRLALLALLASCGERAPIQKTDLLLRVTPGAFEVGPGEPFPLTVTRVWSKDLDPGPWSEKALAPLAVRLEEETRRDDGTRIEETRRYLAHAFSLSDVVVPGVKLVARPRDGGAERKVTATGFRIRVRPALDALNPGPPELPGEPPPSRGWMWGGLGGLLACAALVVFLALRRRRPVEASLSAAPGPPPLPAHERALARLAAASAEEAADILRGFLADTRDARALERTTEELLAATPSKALADVLLPCDLVKFAARALTAPERDHVLASARAFVREAAR